MGRLISRNGGWIELTCHELEGLGLHGLLGIGFRNGTHFGCERKLKEFLGYKSGRERGGGWRGEEERGTEVELGKRERE